VLSLSLFKLPKPVQFTLGISGVVIVIGATIIMSNIGFSNAKAGSYQVSAQNCFQSKKVDSTACEHFIKFGVSPQLYLSNESYRHSIDDEYRKAIVRNAYIAPQIAQFTLDHAYKKHIKLTADLVEHFQELVEED